MALTTPPPNSPSLGLPVCRDSQALMSMASPSASPGPSPSPHRSLPPPPSTSPSPALAQFKEDRQRERMMLRELKKFHHEHPGLVASCTTKKRLRVPRVDAETNPFCMERQLADEYEQLNFNKNPRFYINTIKNSPRVEENPRNHSSYINDSADLLASSGFSPHVRAEFSGACPPVAYNPAAYALPSVISVDASDSRSYPKNHPLSPERNAIHVTSTLAPPTHAHYSAAHTTQAVSFGHRPQSAARLYDPLTSNVQRSVSKRNELGLRAVRTEAKTQIRTGMSVLRLQELLTPGRTSESSASARGSSRTEMPSRKSTRGRRKVPSMDAGRSDIAKEEEDKERAKAVDELERGFDNATYYPPKARKAFRFPPPSDQTTLQLIDKYRKLAVGKMPPSS